MSPALSPPVPCGFLPWPFPSLKSVGALSLEKSFRVQRCTRTRLFDFLPSKDHGVDEIVSRKKKKKILTWVFFFSSFFEVQFCFLYFLIFILCFYLCPSCFQQGLEVLKTLWKVCSVDISNRTGVESMTYELLPLWCPITKAESRECKAWMYQACISSRGTAKIKELLMGISKDK